MFDYTILHWTTFFGVAVLLNLSPGPDVAFILAHSAKGGRRAGFTAMFGIWTGALMHVLMAAVGLSAILVTSSVAFSIVKWAGAIYLIWLGIQALKSKGSGFHSEDGISVDASSQIFRQGILVAVLNPKVAIFFLAFLPQLVVEGAGPVWAQLSLHGILIIAVAALIEPPLVIVGDRIAKTMRESQQLGLWIDRGLGSILIILGIRLALSER